MWVGKFALSPEGLPAGGVAWVDLGTTAASSPAVVNGAAYHPTYQSLEGVSALYVTTEAVAASDAYIGGFRYRSDGALRVYDATSAVPAGANTNQGIALTSDGQLCYTTGNTTAFALNGVAVDTERRVYAAPLAFELQFADLGSGVVDTTEEITGAAATFTRATTAWTRLSTGLWAAVASGDPRSYYAEDGTYLGYLAEGARTNSALHGRKIAAGVTATEWTESNVTAADNATGIDGVANAASTLTAGANNGTILQSRTIASAAKTLSAFVRRKTGTGAVYLTLDNDTTRTEITSLINSSTYTQVSATQTLANPVFGFKLAVDTDAIEVDMVMLENSASFASTPIPTTTIAVARNADVLTYPTTGWLSATAGTMFQQLVPFNVTTTQVPLSLDDGTNANAIYHRIISGPSSRLVVTDATVGQVNLAVGVPVANTSYAQASAYLANDFASCVDGGTVATDTGGSIPAGLDILQLGAQAGAGSPFFGPIRRVAYYAARLANATLQGLTS